MTEPTLRRPLATASAVLSLSTAAWLCVSDAGAAAATHTQVEQCPSLSDRGGARILTGLSGAEIKTGVGQDCDQALTAPRERTESTRPLHRRAPAVARIVSYAPTQPYVMAPQDVIAQQDVFAQQDSAFARASAATSVRAGSMSEVRLQREPAFHESPSALLVAMTALLSVLFLMRRRQATLTPYGRFSPRRLRRLVLPSAAADVAHYRPRTDMAALMAAFNHVQEAAVILDRRGHIELANDAFAALACTTPDALHGIELSAIGWIADALSTGPDRHPWSRAMATSHPWSVEALDFVPPQRGISPLAIRCTPILAHDATVQGCIVTLDDCTERLAAAERDRQVQAELSACREARQSERHDLLTGCLSRAAFFERMTQARLDAVRNRRPLSCIALSVEMIKPIEHSNSAGNRLLQAIGETLRAATRQSDIVGRCGDDEFLIGLPGCHLDTARALSEKLRRAVEASLHLDDLRDMHPEISLGVGIMHDGDDVLTHLIERADLALDIGRRAARARTAKQDAPGRVPADRSSRWHAPDGPAASIPG